MPEKGFVGRRRPKLSETQIALNASILDDMGSGLSRFAVKRKFNDFGEAWEEQGSVFILMWGYSEPIKYSDWHAVAADGWSVD